MPRGRGARRRTRRGSRRRCRRDPRSRRTARRAVGLWLGASSRRRSGLGQVARSPCDSAVGRRVAPGPARCSFRHRSRALRRALAHAPPVETERFARAPGFSKSSAAAVGCCSSWHENRGPGGSVRPRAYGRVIRDRGVLGERRRQAVLDDGLRARAFPWPPLRLARIVPRARIGLCRSPAASPVFVDS